METVLTKVLEKIQWSSGSKAHYLENSPIWIQSEQLVPAESG